jgi:transketolase
MNPVQTALSIDELKRLSNELRSRIIQMSHDAKAPHLASCLSCIDILSVVYWNFLKIDPSNPNDENRDRFILSKGHGAAAFYATLAYRGFFPKEMLKDYVKNGTRMPEHPSRFKVPGVETATGSLGHGLSVGLGMALAAKTNKKDYKVFVLVSDGECNEGSTWEAALFASANKLDNVVVFVDYNKWQATGRSNEILKLAPLKQKWDSFGWNSYEIDGNNIEEVNSTIKNIPEHIGKPTIIIANTIKGKGISFMEDDNNWHYKIPTEEEIVLANKELGI